MFHEFFADDKPSMLIENYIIDIHILLFKYIIAGMYAVAIAQTGPLDDDQE